MKPPLILVFLSAIVYTCQANAVPSNGLEDNLKYTHPIGRQGLIVPYEPDLYDYDYLDHINVNNRFGVGGGFGGEGVAGMSAGPGVNIGLSSAANRPRGLLGRIFGRPRPSGLGFGVNIPPPPPPVPGPPIWPAPIPPPMRPPIPPPMPPPIPPPMLPPPRPPGFGFGPGPRYRRSLQPRISSEEIQELENKFGIGIGAHIGAGVGLFGFGGPRYPWFYKH